MQTSILDKALYTMRHKGFSALLKRSRTSIILRIFPFKNKILKILNASYVTSYYGIKLTSNWDDKTFIMSADGREGIEFSTLLQTQNQPFILLDIGANQGIYSLMADKNEHCEHAIAFEPVKNTYDLLLQNIALNHCRKITTHALAISDEDKNIEISYKAKHSGAANLRGDMEQAGKVTETIQCISHKTLETLIPKSNRYIVKVDVEGLEDKVIKTLCKCPFFPNIHYIFYEINEGWTNPKNIQTMLEKHGFTSFKKVGDNPTHYDILATR